jgi:hypothetical protein
MNKTKAIFLMALTALLAAPGLWAQTSNTSTATASIFSTDVDSYMDVNDFGDAAPDSFFTWLRPSGNGFETGYARYLGGGYLGLYGTGSFLNGSFSKTITENNAGSLETAPTNDGMGWSSQVDILYGTESLGGFKLSLFTYGENNDTDLNETSPNDSVETKNRIFVVSPSLEWGKNFSVSPGVFKFAVGLGTAFTIANSTVTTVAGGTTTSEVTTNAGVTVITLNPRVTWVMNPRGNAQSELFASYSLGFIIYPDVAYEDSKATGFAVKEMEQDNSGTIHVLEASFKTTYTTSDTFSWGWGAGVEFDITTSEIGKVKTTLGNGTSATGTNTSESTTFDLIPRGALGISYKLKPGVLTLNGGIEGYLPFRLGTSGSESTTGTVTTETSTITFNNMRAVVRAGIAWQLTPELGLDSYLSYYAPTSKDVGITAISILATYKR